MATVRPVVEIPEASTRTRLIMTAMRLFAADGVGKVSLRTISAESGSRNTAAAHYHFENKLGLVEAVLGFIRREVWDPAQRRLEEAIEREVNTILLGINYEKPFGEFSLGDTLPYVLKYAPCSVLIYREPIPTKETSIP